MKSSEDKKRPTIALTGASGYIGSNLLKLLIKDADVIALSRHAMGKKPKRGVEWRSGDLFSMADAEQALEGADFAVYLVHSMLPTAKLTQASFEDMDVILADHFARAAKRVGVKQLVYLSGILPPATPPEELSAHLRSRLEVQRVLESYDIPVTTVRAGLIVGPESSSFPILAKLVRRLPYMIMPRWTSTKTQPIALSEILAVLQRSIGNEEVYGRTIDAGGPDVMSYREMLKQTADIMGKKIPMVSVPFFSVYLSRLWVSLITGTPKAMAYPLIESLVHPMVARPPLMGDDIGAGKIPFREAARQALDEEERMKQIRREKQDSEAENSPSRQGHSNEKKAPPDVRSVQRIPLPPGKDALWAGRHYLEWLSSAYRPLLRAELHTPGEEKIYRAFSRRPLLELSFAADRSEPDRAIYWITGGVFAKASIPHRGRIEFLQVPGADACIVAIHDYLPTLPWIFYKYTQAKVHLWVMAAFKRHMRRQIRKSGMKVDIHASESEASNRQSGSGRGES